jgi:hypothetical protein
MRARQVTRTAQQRCGAVAVGQLDTEDEPDVGSSQPLFLRCQTLAGTFGLAQASDLRSAEAPSRPWPSSGFQIRVKGAGEQIAYQLAVIQRARPKSGKFKDALNAAQSRLEVGD